MPTESVYIFDACAIIALLDAEPGAEVVEKLLADEATVASSISSTFARSTTTSTGVLISREQTS